MNENDKQINDVYQMAKEQWEKMGLDPNQMMKYITNAQEIMKETLKLNMDIPSGSASLGQSTQQQADTVEREVDKDDLALIDRCPEVKEKSDVERIEDQKAMACGANLAYLNCLYLNTLQTFRPHGHIVEMLKTGWDIEFQDEFIETLQWLENEGNRTAFNEIYDAIKSVPKAELAMTVERLSVQLLTEGFQYDEKELWDIAKQTLYGYSLLKENGFFKTKVKPSLLSWDFERAILLCRAGYDLGFLTKDEALQRINLYAQKMYAEYDSWRSLSEGYLMGYFVWSGNEEGLEELFNDHASLLEHKDSPWKRFPW
ncbi:MAG: DUF1266 domain-containing protein [Chitinivibrionales bacterium]|nr:DUF1266 domain-containing protein [Chitinivibrionales bacterium]